MNTGFNYIGSFNKLPNDLTIKGGDICSIDNDYYVYIDNEWNTLATSSGEYKPERKYPVICKRCGAALKEGVCEYCGSDYRGER